MPHQPSASEPILLTDLLHRLTKQAVTAKPDFANDLLEYFSQEIVHKALTGDLPVNAKDFMFAPR